MTASNNAPFQLGVSLTTLDPEQRPETIRMLGGSSVKSVEIWGPTFSKDADQIQEARQAFAVAGIELRRMHADFGSSVDISSPDSAIRSAGVQAFRTALDLAVRMGAGMVIMHPSSEPIGDDARAARMQHAKRSIEAIAEIARDAGCRVAFELLPRTCLGRSAAELLDLLEGVDAETTGVCLDTNHLMGPFGSLPEVVRSLAPRLFALHCSDYDGVDEKHWTPLRGVIDWGGFLSALRAVGFSGPILYEASLDGETPAERLAFLEANFAQLLETLPRSGEA